MQGSLRAVGKTFEPVWHNENQIAALIVAPSDYRVAPDLNAVP